MIISEITINESREIDSIKINLDDNLINYLSNEEGVSLKGTPSFFTLRNFDVSKLNLDIAIQKKNNIMKSRKNQQYNIGIYQ